MILQWDVLQRQTNWGTRIRDYYLVFWYDTTLLRASEREHAQQVSSNANYLGLIIFTQIYSFATGFSAATFAFKTRLRIFPLGDLGMTSNTLTPPFNHLCLALCSSTC